MRAQRVLSTALLTVAASGALLAAAPAASAACPGADLGTVEAGVCEYFTVTSTPNTGYTVSGTVVSYCTIAAQQVCYNINTQWFNDYPYLYATGVDVNGATPPIPTFDPVSGQLSAPAGTYGTLYVNGIPVPLDTPAYCFTINVRCP